MARTKGLRLRELRRIRLRFMLILGGMGLVTLLILMHLAFRTFAPQAALTFTDFASLCFYAGASLIMTIAQILFFRQLSRGPVTQIEDLTFLDELTGLGNRRLIARFLNDEFQEAQLSRTPLSALFVDLDKFKQINDEYGHSAGDLVLKAVGHALRSSIRETDFAGRIGGDEFLVLLPDTDSQCASVVAHRIAERIFAISIYLEAGQLENLSASIGISCFPHNANSRESLVEDSDRTMYAAKTAGPGNISVSMSRPGGAKDGRIGNAMNLADRIESIMEKRPDAAKE